MVLAVIGHRVALVMDAPDHRGVGTRHAADDEEGRLHAFGCECLEDAIGVRRQRTVVEGEHDFMVVERQRFAILHRADTGVLAGIDDKGATDAKSAGWALLGLRRADQQSQQSARGDGAAHPYFNSDLDRPAMTPATLRGP